MRKSVITLAVIIPVAMLGILYVPSLVTRVSMRQYNFGQEIKGFPIDKTSVTEAKPYVEPVIKRNTEEMHREIERRIGDAWRI